MRTLPAILALCLGFVSLGSAQPARSLGWKSDPKGMLSAYYHTKPEYKSTVLLTKTDLRPISPKIWDQLDKGSCVPHGNGRAYAIAYKSEYGVLPCDLSLLGFYYDCRVHDGTVNYDSGSYISTAAGIMMANGVGCICTWPYDTSKYLIKPPAKYYADAPHHKMIQAVKIDSGTSKDRHIGIITALSNNRAVAFGGFVYNGIYNVSKNDPYEPMPSGKAIGGHCRCIVGSDDNMTHQYSKSGKIYKGFYLVANSWGEAWGLSGYSWIPYDYIDSLKYNDDFWVYMKAAK